MASDPKAIRLDTREFERVMREYLRHTQRDLATVYNTKGFYIARRSTKTTRKADRKAIRALARAPWIYKLVNALRARSGKAGLYGEKMKEAVKTFINRRISSIAFIKSGWIPAIKGFEPLAEKRGAPSQDRSAVQRGKPHGAFRRASPGFRVIARLENFAQSRTDRGHFLKVGLTGLRAAFGHEVASMKEYIARKLTARAKSLRIRTK